jgi:alkylation response protein AidB-like acyl-CoA dehydrogenase
MGTAVRKSNEICLNGQKSWVTSASHVTAYVWSSRPLGSDAPSTLWLVPRNSEGIATSGTFDGLGLRGNDSTPVSAEDVLVPEQNRLGDDGAGLDIMLGTVLPIFNVMTAGCAVGLMEGATEATVTHVVETRHRHLDSSLASLATIRAYLAPLRD